MKRYFLPFYLFVIAMLWFPGKVLLAQVSQDTPIRLKATSDFDHISVEGFVPYYIDKARNVLAINAAEEQYRGKEAAAHHTFTGEKGSYALTLYTMKETDGECEYTVSINGKEVLKTKNPPTQTDYAIHESHPVKIKLKPGDLLQVMSSAATNGRIPEGNATAYARGRWIELKLLPGMPFFPFPDKVLVTKVRHFDNMCWKIAAAGGTWYFENGETDGKTGFSSAFDQAGNDWIGNDADKGYNMSPSTGGKHEYRGWPNFGEDNFNHPQRKSNSGSWWVDEHGNKIKFDEKLEGDHLIMRSSNDKYELEYHFFPTHAAIKILKADDKYAFLFEGPIGGEQDASVDKDYYVLKDGKHRETKTGGLGYLEPEFGNKFPSPFFYLVDSDPNDHQVFYVGVKNTGPESAGDEGWRQGENMVIFSYGRDEDKRAYTGTEAICVFGFHEKAPHKKISRFITNRLENPFIPIK